jgi:hypothetical protein
MHVCLDQVADMIIQYTEAGDNDVAADLYATDGAAAA